MILFLSVVVIMTLVAIAVVVVPMLREPGDRATIAAVLSALAIPVAVVVLYATTSNYPWSATAGTGEGTFAGPAAADSQDIAALRAAVASSPGDIDGWVRLADALFAQERFADARDAYREAIVRSGGGDDALRLAMAEATILVDPSSLSGEAGQVVDDILTRDPFNAKALWYSGMAALGRGDRETAASRWSKLLELGPPPAVRTIIEQQLASIGGGPAPDPDKTAGGFRVPVRISIEPGLAAKVRPGAILFLIARDPAAGGKGPPLAVVRREANAFPVEATIGDADAMIPGKGLASLPELQLVARIANGGDATPSKGDAFGEALWRSAAGDGPAEILINGTVQ